MRSITFTEFRQQASELITGAENGETILILRHGRPVAKLSPCGRTKSDKAAWQKPGLRLVTRGAGLARAILAERQTS